MNIKFLTNAKIRKTKSTLKICWFTVPLSSYYVQNNDILMRNAFNYYLMWIVLFSGSLSKLQPQMSKGMSR